MPGYYETRKLRLGYIGVIYGIMEKKIETTIVYWGNIGIMEKEMEATIVYWGYIGIMENKLETTIVCWGLYWDNGKENGSYYIGWLSK